MSAWLLLPAGVDLMALFAASWSGIQNLSDFCVVFLMLNLLDAFRIETLFAPQTNRSRNGEQDTGQLPRMSVYEHKFKRFWLLSKNIGR